MSLKQVEALQKDLRTLDVVFDEQGMPTSGPMYEEARYLVANAGYKYIDMSQHIIDELTGVDLAESSDISTTLSQSERMKAKILAGETRLRR